MLHQLTYLANRVESSKNKDLLSKSPILEVVCYIVLLWLCVIRLTNAGW